MPSSTHGALRSQQPSIPEADVMCETRLMDAAHAACVQVSPGKYESVGVEHSWDSPFRLSNMCLFKLQRHADHHIAAGKRYQLLLAQKDAPQLPCGYPGSILLAFAPPAWFRVMNPRIHALRARHPGRVWRFGPSPCAGDSAAGDSAAGGSAAGGSAAGAPVQKSKDT
eukprot:TRINITY_DN7254_c0_g1_i2.p3 TRINITY_DN7254_c0_g1~~TRINITY_DN7254_c0_g1_i2.p3  ORF type:complete len:168 (+),score=35.85 TRINITY_DN7254_c0_g1_i2:561-1064(+)